MRKQADPTFTLSHASLEKIFSALQVPRPATGLILFGFRGCRPVSAMATWGKSVRLASAPVDHVHMRCTLGIWDPARKRVFAAPGSTVPHKEQVEKAAARKGKLKGKGANQIEPGYYVDLTKGEHLQGKLNGHQALRQTAGRFYRRSPSGIPYSAASPLFYGNPYDNLHCGWNLDGEGPGFSSAGCMVVAGIPHCHRHENPKSDQGPWKIFHDILYAVDQKSFPILLLRFPTASAIQEGAAKPRSGLRANLIYGSSGEAVKDLQRLLAAEAVYGGRITGKLDARTYRAWNAALARLRR